MTSPAPAVMSAGASRERSERDLCKNRVRGEGADVSLTHNSLVSQISHRAALDRLRGRLLQHSERRRYLTWELYAVNR